MNSLVQISEPVRRRRVKWRTRLEQPMPQRPKTRGDCVGGLRPCPWATCVHHIVHLRNPAQFGELVPSLDDWPETCVLDVADRDGATLQEVASAIGVTRERARQMESAALASVGKASRRQVLVPFIDHPDGDLVGKALEQAAEWLAEGRSMAQVAVDLTAAGHGRWPTTRLEDALERRTRRRTSPGLTYIQTVEMILGGGDMLSARDIAERSGVPYKSIIQVVATMRERGLIESFKGDGHGKVHRLIGGRR